MSKVTFPLRANKSPKIYGYTQPGSEYEGLIKVGYTEQEGIKRIEDQFKTKGPDGIKRYDVLFLESAMREDGTSFWDHDVHNVLKKAKFRNAGGEWFECSVNDLKSAVIAVKNRTAIDLGRTNDFDLRPEQKEAVRITKNYFRSYSVEENKTPHFLWNCKMRFGKTFTSYKLAEQMNWKKVLILSFKTAVEESWEEDLSSHKDFKSWQFIRGKEESIDDIDANKPFVCFASFQDFLGKNKAGGIKVKNKWAHAIEWDCIILDEYHYGAWNENSKGLLSSDDETNHEEQKELDKESGIQNSQKLWNEDVSPLKTNHYLYLSGTPFRAIESGEFIEEQIYNWTYSDEQEAKEDWEGDNNPYQSMPKMVMMTYKMPESISQITETGEFDEFDLNEFFKAEGEGTDARFKHEDHVQQWLNLIRGSGFNNIYTNRQLGADKPPLPFADSRLINTLTHTFWFLPNVASCNAMKNLMMQASNTFYHDYEILVCAGPGAGIGKKALGPLKKLMANPLKSKTITLSCSKLNTGVTVRPWTGVFFLRNTSSPETYFQTAFRVQSPWTIKKEDSPNIEESLKEQCYVFDFAPNRALRLLTDYSCRLNVNENNPEQKVKEFIKFLPVLCFDGSSMRQIDAQEVLDFGMVGATGPQLAKKFESRRLVHVDDMTLTRLMQNEEAMEALMKIEGFRKINSDIEHIINKSEKINKLKKDANEEELSKKKKKELTDAEKDNRGKRKQIQDKLLQFASRIPIFMYLTDHREQTLYDVITEVEPKLFRRVTSLTVENFELLISLKLFNAPLMNSAILSFKRYENDSLNYKGYRRHIPEKIGLYDTVISAEEFHSQ
jgi:hypothetical protein